MKLFIECILLGLFIMSTIGGIAEVLYNIENKKATPMKTWYIPAVIFMIFWFIHNHY